MRQSPDPGQHLSAASSCNDYVNASLQEQNFPVAKIAQDVGSPDAVTPRGRPNIDHLCASDSTMTLGEAVRRTE